MGNQTLYGWIETDFSEFSNRDPYSLDFLGAEVTKGWVSSHVTLPAFFTLLTGNAWIGIASAALFELFETIAVVVFDDFVVFETADSELETMAGSLIGDVGNGILGALLAYSILWASRERHPMGILSWTRRSFIKQDWWHSLVYSFTVSITNIMIQVVYPAACIDEHPQLYTCLNIGHWFAVVTKLGIYYSFFFFTKTPPGWRNADTVTFFDTHRDWTVQVALWFTTTTVIELMSLQNLVPVYTGSPFFQVHAATLCSISVAVSVGVWNRYRRPGDPSMWLKLKEV